MIQPIDDDDVNSDSCTACDELTNENDDQQVRMDELTSGDQRVLLDELTNADQQVCMDDVHDRALRDHSYGRPASSSKQGCARNNSTSAERPKGRVQFRNTSAQVTTRRWDRVCQSPNVHDLALVHSDHSVNGCAASSSKQGYVDFISTPTELPKGRVQFRNTSTQVTPRRRHSVCQSPKSLLLRVHSVEKQRDTARNKLKAAIHQNKTKAKRLRQYKAAILLPQAQNRVICAKLAKLSSK